MTGDLVTETLSSCLIGLAQAVVDGTVEVITDGPDNEPIGVRWPSPEGDCWDEYLLDRE